MDVGEILHCLIQRFSPERCYTFLSSLATELHLLAIPSRPIPVARIPVLLEKTCVPQLVKAAQLIWRVLHNHAFQTHAAAHVPVHLLPPGVANVHHIPFDPCCNIGCIDFHIEAGSLKVIELMALPPGMVGIYPGLVARYAEFLNEYVDQGCTVVDFMEGWSRSRCEQLLVDHIVGKGASEVVAIVDWEPETQVTYGEFLYTKELVERSRPGIRCVIADPREVSVKDARPWIRGLPVGRILNRLTMVDWVAHAEEIREFSRLLWDCPSVFVYDPYRWFLADKHTLVVLSDKEALLEMGYDTVAIEEITALVPVTRMLKAFVDVRTRRVHMEKIRRYFGTPHDIVLKPVASHASKGIIYGPRAFSSDDVFIRKVLSIPAEEYVIMKRVSTPEMLYPTGEGTAELWKYDVRVFILDDTVAFVGGRIYVGDYTNQLPCRYFAPLLFA